MSMVCCPLCVGGRWSPIAVGPMSLSAARELHPWSQWNFRSVPRVAWQFIIIFFFSFLFLDFIVPLEFYFLFLGSCCSILISLFRRGGLLQMMETAPGVQVACCCTALLLDWCRSAGQLYFCLTGDWCSLLCGHRRLLPFLMAAVIGSPLWQVRHFALCWSRVWIGLLLVFLISLNGSIRCLIPTGLTQLIPL